MAMKENNMKENNSENERKLKAEMKIRQWMEER